MVGALFVLRRCLSSGGSGFNSVSFAGKTAVVTGATKGQKTKKKDEGGEG